MNFLFNLWKVFKKKLFKLLKTGHYKMQTAIKPESIH